MSNINIEEFIKKFTEIFDEVDPANITADTAFKSLEEWDSMHALAVIAMADEDFNLKVRGDDIRNSITVKDLFNKIRH